MKKENGITLVALVITIIVLLILAGVSISAVVGEEGLLTKAKSATEKNENESYLEEVKIALVEFFIERKTGDSDVYPEEVVDGLYYEEEDGEDVNGFYEVYKYKERRVKVYFDENYNITDVILEDSE